MTVRWPRDSRVVQPYLCYAAISVGVHMTHGAFVTISITLRFRGSSSRQSPVPEHRLPGVAVASSARSSDSALRGSVRTQWRDASRRMPPGSRLCGGRFTRVLHQAGAHVPATARRADLLDQVARECGERIEVLPGDITDAAHRQGLARRLAAHGRLDVLINNKSTPRRAGSSPT